MSGRGTGADPCGRSMSKFVGVRRGIATSIGIALAVAIAADARATEGYFQNGYGARSKALAGAGVADQRDATAVSLNPAGIVNAGNEYVSSFSLFNPQRETTFSPGGVVESERNWFLIPNMAANWKLSGTPWADAIAFSMYGNGGMNTNYPGYPNPACGGGTGIFCGGRAGVNLEQIMLSVAAAKRFGAISVGVAPILAIQKFRARGLDAAFGVPDRGNDWALGGGLRAGIEATVAKGVRLGLAASTPIWSQKFDKYAGLFAERGGFDIPASVQAGIAVDVAPAVTFMLDYRRIFYTGTASVSNPSTNMAPLGADNGPGFGWKDVDVVKFGVEWRSTDKLTLRAGYSYNTQPIQARDVTFNILAPGVMQHHVTGGLSYRISDRVDVELAGTYAPYQSVIGPNPNPMAPPGSTIKLGMEQFEITAGFKYRFGP